MGHVDWSVLNPRNPRRPSRSCQKKGCGLQGSRSDPGLALGLCQGPEATSPQATDTINEWYGKEEAECGEKQVKRLACQCGGWGGEGFLTHKPVSKALETKEQEVEDKLWRATDSVAAEGAEVQATVGWQAELQVEGMAGGPVAHSGKGAAATTVGPMDGQCLFL